MRAIALFILTATSAMAYVHFLNGTEFLSRTDNANIQFYLNTVAVGGLNNDSGKTWITAGSDIPGATAAALNTWNQVTTANVHFAPVEMTTALQGGAGQNTIIFNDTIENRQLLGEAIAVTVRYGDGTLDRTDIIFSPQQVFSTNLDAGAFDYQSVLTHELGHSLGADHSGVLSATMFQAGSLQNPAERVLSADDMAFVTETYPAASTYGPLGYGTLAGTVQDASGNALRGALITAQDPTTGVVIGSFSNLQDGTFSFIVPAGSYQLWAEPLTGFVKAANLYLAPSVVVDTTFQAGTPSAPYAVTAGSTTQARIVTGAGTSPIIINYAGSVPTGATNVELYGGPSGLNSGQQVGFVFVAAGLGTDFTDTNISFVGPVSVVPGSVLSDGNSEYQMLLNVPDTSTVTAASMILNYGGNTASYSGGFVVQPVAPQFTAAGVGNAFSYSSGAVAPGEIVAIFGTNMGPAAAAAGALNAGGDLANILSSMQVTFDGVPAPIFFASTGQINVEVPYEVAGKTSTTLVVSSGISASGPVPIPVQSGVPGLYPSALNPDGTLNSAANPSHVGQYVSLFATGLGALTYSGQPVATGALVAGAASATGVTVTIDGASSVPYYAGAAPGFTGLDQVNLVGLTAGKHSVALVSGPSLPNVPLQTIPVWIQ